jgi:hypothetical protein
MRAETPQVSSSRTGSRRLRIVDSYQGNRVQQDFRYEHSLRSSRCDSNRNSR